MSAQISLTPTSPGAARVPTESTLPDVPSSVVVLARGATLFHEGDAAESYFKLVSGAIRCCRVLADGRRHIGDFFLPGDFIGLGADDFYAVRAEAMGDTTLLRYSRRAIDALVEEQPRLSRWLLSLACTGLAAAQRQKLLLGRKTAPERIASFLSQMAERTGPGDHIHLPMTRTDIGDYLGLTTETVSRALSQLRSEGIIALQGLGELHILDRDALEDLAGEV